MTRHMGALNLESDRQLEATPHYTTGAGTAQEQLTKRKQYQQDRHSHPM